MVNARRNTATRLQQISVGYCNEKLSLNLQKTRPNPHQDLNGVKHANSKVTEHSAANPPQLPDAITNKSGGNPTPTYLTNMTMETYFQGSTAGGSDVTLYNTTIANTTAWHQIEGFQQYGNVSYLIFGTEGCMGCHYSASIATGKTIFNGEPVATYGASATADFSWLLQLKAQFKTAKTSH